MLKDLLYQHSQATEVRPALQGDEKGRISFPSTFELHESEHSSETVDPLNPTPMITGQKKPYFPFYTD